MDCVAARYTLTPNSASARTCAALREFAVHMRPEIPRASFRLLVTLDLNADRALTGAAEKRGHLVRRHAVKRLHNRNVLLELLDGLHAGDDRIDVLAEREPQALFDRSDFVR